MNATTARPTSRVIPRLDMSNEPVAFLADSFSDDGITMWRPSNSETLRVDKRYYDQSTPLSEEKVKEVARQFRNTWLSDVQIMARLPRVIHPMPDMKLRKQSNVRAAEVVKQEDAPEIKPIEEIIATTWKMSQPANEESTNVNNSFVMVCKGGMWRINNQQGKTVAYAVDEEDAVRVLRSFTEENV